MKFQCRIEQRTAIHLNGRLLPLDQQGCLETEDPEDIRKLKGSTEWTTAIAQRALPPSTQAPVPAIKGAGLFLDAYNADGDFRGKVDALRSPITRASFLASHGFKFTEEELTAEIAKRAPPVPEPDAEPAQAAPLPSTEPPSKKRKGIAR
jgi:predicted ribosomally synthesized peptide with nif11-like leader